VATERIQRHVERLLAEAEEALSQLAWDDVLVRAEGALALDPENADASGLIAAARRALRLQAPPAEPGVGRASAPVADHPSAFCEGRYVVKRFLGEGGRKRVYLCHDAKLDRDVAFALIKTEGLEAEGLTRIRREAQAMGRLGDHPHIVSVHDIGEEGGCGSLFCVRCDGRR
jgi:hypothetical protein